MTVIQFPNRSRDVLLVTYNFTVTQPTWGDDEVHVVHESIDYYVVDQWDGSLGQAVRAISRDLDLIVPDHCHVAVSAGHVMLSALHPTQKDQLCENPKPT